MIIIPHKFPELELTENFTLTNLKVDYALDYFNYINDDNVKNFVEEDSVPNSIADAIDEMHYWHDLHLNRRSLYWGIIKNNQNLIGTIGFNEISKHHHRASLSYDLDYNYWGQGIMYKALQKICGYAFEKLKIQRIQAFVMEQNHRSSKLLIKNKFSYEGTLVNYARLRDKYYNFKLFSLVGT